jgi:hypothetical protein
LAGRQGANGSDMYALAQNERCGWDDFGRWQQLLQVVAHLTTVTGDNRNERLEGMAYVFTRERLLRAGELLIEAAISDLCADN